MLRRLHSVLHAIATRQEGEGLRQQFEDVGVNRILCKYLTKTVPQVTERRALCRILQKSLCRCSFGKNRTKNQDLIELALKKPVKSAEARPIIKNAKPKKAKYEEVGSETPKRKSLNPFIAFSKDLPTSIVNTESVVEVHPPPKNLD